jgi:hypothetical protein
MNGRNKYEVKAGDTPLSPRSELVCHQTINIYLIYLLSLVFETNLIVIILVFTKCIHTCQCESQLRYLSGRAEQQAE